MNSFCFAGLCHNQAIFFIFNFEVGLYKINATKYLVSVLQKKLNRVPVRDSNKVKEIDERRRSFEKELTQRHTRKNCYRNKDYEVINYQADCMYNYMYSSGLNLFANKPVAREGSISATSTPSFP